MTSVVPLPENWRRKHLSPAEQRVVELIATGLPTKAVAARLGKSTLTARNQLSDAMRKLGLKNRYELIAALRPLRTEDTLGTTRPTMETTGEFLEYAI